MPLDRLVIAEGNNVIASHAAVVAILGPLYAHLAEVVRAARREGRVEQPALVVVTPGREHGPVREALGTAASFREVNGHHYTVAPLARVRALADMQTFNVAQDLDQPIEPREMWCLLLGPGGRVAASVIAFPEGA